VTDARALMRSLLDERWARASLRVCDEVGLGARVDGWPTVRNSGTIRLGRSFRFSSSPSPSHLVCGPGAAIDVGDDVTIAHGAAIAVFAGLTIGAGTSIGPFAAIMDTDFHVVGKRETNAPPEPIAIGPRVRIGAHVTILRGSRIEEGAVVDAGSVVVGKVGAGVRVSGVPAREAVRHEAHGGGSVADSILGVVSRSLGLARPPSSNDGPATIPQWDSLGGLRLLLALEDAFGVVLPEDEVLRVTTVGDLTGLVGRAVARASSVGANP
jgi:acetyltransferase-like isoleucine patch superfamily enzyme/acyl carrier protein